MRRVRAEAAAAPLASRSWKRTPPQWTPLTIQPVTQWNVETCSTFGSASSSVVGELERPATRPSMRSRHVARSKVGIVSATV